MQNLPVPISNSKLYPPPIAADLVVRHQLWALSPLQSGAAFTLISAPAGYGKSTLASHWISEFDGISVWLSLDKPDSDIRQFLSYIVAGLSSTLCDHFSETVKALQSSNVPAVEELAATFYNEVRLAESPVALFLDDYHQISSSDVHAFMDLILKRPPRNLHVVIMTRRDPPLSLHALRASGHMREVRMPQLAFQSDETLQFLRAKVGSDFNDETIATLHARTEGWPAGLRLATLAVTNANRSDTVIANIPADPRFIRDYLLQEVLANCPAPMRDYLIRTSILDRFSAPLCERVYRFENERAEDTSGTEFISWLTGSGLFAIALDGRNQWFRYHHLFQSLLIAEATAELGEAAVRRMNTVAAAWFEDQELFEDAISHLLAIGDASAAAELIIRHRHAITNNEHWHRLNHWLMQLPKPMLESNPELLLLKARWLRTAGSREESEAALLKAESMVKTSNLSDELRNELYGSLASSQSFVSWTQGNGPLAQTQAQRAMELLPQDSAAERGFAMIILAGSMQMTGDAAGARRMLKASLSDAASNTEVHPTFHIRLFLSLSFLSWMDADLMGLHSAATEAISLSESTGLREVLTVSRCMLAAVHYHRNELDLVNETIRPALNDQSFASNEFQVQCLALASLTHQLSGNERAALEAAHTLHDLALKSHNIFIVELSEAFRAELAMRQGRMAEAMQWAQQYHGQHLVPTYAFYSPTMTHLKILVLNDSKQSRELASALLEDVVTFLSKNHQMRFLAEALALRALLSDSLGNGNAAAEDLQAAIEIAQPGRFVRLFADLGPRLGKLLSRLNLNEEGLFYAGEILAAMTENTENAPTAGTRSRQTDSVDPLSRREEQVLALLAQRLSNKEIAERLNISTVTVKRHVANIFQKLDVHGRRQAVAKANGLGLIVAH